MADVDDTTGRGDRLGPHPPKSAGLRDLIDRLGTSGRTLAALGAAIGARVEGTELNAALRDRLDEVLDALGLRRQVAQADPAELRPVLGAIRTELFLCARLASGASGGGAWDGADAAVLQAAGDVSAGFPGVLRRSIVPQLDGLSDRLAAPGALVLDIGVGVAAMAAGLLREWPSLRVVGVDPLAPALALARENIRSLGLEDRIELREGRAEELEDEDRFDLAWVPGLFIPGESCPPFSGGRAGRSGPGAGCCSPMRNPAQTRSRRRSPGSGPRSGAARRRRLRSSGMRSRGRASSRSRSCRGRGAKRSA